MGWNRPNCPLACVLRSREEQQQGPAQYLLLPQKCSLMAGKAKGSLCSVSHPRLGAPCPIGSMQSSPFFGSSFSLLIYPSQQYSLAAAATGWPARQGPEGPWPGHQVPGLSSQPRSWATTFSHWTKIVDGTKWPHVSTHCASISRGMLCKRPNFAAGAFYQKP